MDIDIVKKSFNEISKLSGFLNFESYKMFFLLEEILESKSPILEIGVFCGRSFLGLAMAFQNNLVLGVDPFYEDFFDSPAIGYEAGSLTSKSKNLSASERISDIHTRRKLLYDKYGYPTESNIIIKQATQSEFLLENKQAFSVCHIDGEHTIQSVQEALNSLPEILEPSGWLVVDDILNDGFPVIAEAIYSHAQFKKTYYPVIIGFSKGLFLYKPSDTQLSDAKLHFSKSYANNRNYLVREFADGSLSVRKNKQFINKIEDPIKNIIRNIFGEVF